LNLSPAETRVLEELFLCRSIKEVAADLKVSPRTVKFHATSIYRKAGINLCDGKGKMMQLLQKFGRFEISVKWIPNGKN
jgi:DNA-binding NarL/FixJ family response regulator